MESYAISNHAILPNFARISPIGIKIRILVKLMYPDLGFAGIYLTPNSLVAILSNFFGLYGQILNEPGPDFDSELTCVLWSAPRCPSKARDYRKDHIKSNQNYVWVNTLCVCHDATPGE